MSGMPTLTEHEAAGRNSILNSDLVQLRTKLGLTRSGMAELMSITPITYTRCETADPEYAGRIWRTTAERIGRFVWLANQQLELLEDEGVNLKSLVPLSVIATMLGLPQELLMSWHRTGVIDAEDLGILGLWVYREDEALISEAAGRR